MHSVHLKQYLSPSLTLQLTYKVSTLCHDLPAHLCGKQTGGYQYSELQATKDHQIQTPSAKETLAHAV